MNISEVHAEIDAVIAKLQEAKRYRGGSLRCEIGFAGDRLQKLSGPALYAEDDKDTAR